MIGRPCTICNHDRRAEIETAIRGTQSRRQIALAFCVGRDAIRRHEQEHMAAIDIVPKAPKPSAFLDFVRDVLDIKLTTAQTDFARVVYGGEDPIDVSALAVSIFGCVERFPASVRRVNVERLGRGSAKTLLFVAYGIYRIWTADLSMVGPGDEAGIVVLAPLKNLSARAVQVAENLCKGSPQLSGAVRGANTERVVLERPDGKRAIFLCVPKSGGGAAARGMSVIDFAIDESEYLPPSEPDTAIRDVDLIAAVMPRVIPSGKLFLISTPWPVPSETSRLFKENFGHPISAVVGRASTSVMRAGDPNVESMIAAERLRDPENARREYDCEDIGIAGSFIPHVLIEAAVADSEATRQQASAGMDLGFVSDASALVITERQGPFVAVVRQLLRVPLDGAPLSPNAVVTEFAAECVAANAYLVAADQHYILSARETAARVGVAVCAGPVSQFDREQSLLKVRDLLRNGRARITRDVADQLEGVTAQARPGGGMTITLPRRVGAGHCDLVSAYAMAIWLDRRHGPIVDDAPTPARLGEYHGGLAPTDKGGFQKW